MKMRSGKFLPIIGICLLLLASLAEGQQGQNRPRDVFKGKLFPPNVILDNQQALGLSKEQFTAIRAAVVEVQTNIAEHEWDLRQAYQRVVAELDAKAIDEKAVLKNLEAVLLAENQVKQQQIRMLIRLRNLLTEEQITYLKAHK